MGNTESDEEYAQQGGPVINYYYPQQQQKQATGVQPQQAIIRQQQQRRAVGTNGVLEDTQAKIDMLHREIDHLDRIAAQRTRKAQQMYSEGNKKGALWEAAQVKELGKDKQAKMDNLKRIQSASRTHANMLEFADSQDIINRLTADKQRMAVNLDIEAVHETDLDSRLVDRELDQALASIGITDEDRQEDEVENEAFLQTLLAQQPPTVNNNQQQQQNMIYIGAQQPQRRTNNNNNGGQKKAMSTVDSMLSL